MDVLLSITRKVILNAVFSLSVPLSFFSMREIMSLASLFFYVPIFTSSQISVLIELAINKNHCINYCICRHFPRKQIESLFSVFCAPPVLHFHSIFFLCALSIYFPAPPEPAWISLPMIVCN